jgi:hypothetical protein
MFHSKSAHQYQGEACHFEQQDHQIEEPLKELQQGQQEQSLVFFVHHLLCYNYNRYRQLICKPLLIDNGGNCIQEQVRLRV